jgi:hypothetical protein
MPLPTESIGPGSKGSARQPTGYQGRMAESPRADLPQKGSRGEESYEHTLSGLQDPAPKGARFRIKRA